MTIILRYGTAVSLRTWRSNDRWQNGENYNPWTAYGQSKTANILYTTGLARKLKSKEPIALVLNPGRTSTFLVPLNRLC